MSDAKTYTPKNLTGIVKEDAYIETAVSANGDKISIVYAAIEVTQGPSKGKTEDLSIPRDYPASSARVLNRADIRSKPRPFLEKGTEIMVSNLVREPSGRLRVGFTAIRGKVEGYNP